MQLTAAQAEREKHDADILARRYLAIGPADIMAALICQPKKADKLAA